MNQPGGCVDCGFQGFCRLSQVVPAIASGRDTALGVGNGRTFVPSGTMAFPIKFHRGWGWVLVSGLVAIAAGALIALQLPNSATWVLGVRVGSKMIFAGWSFIALALGGYRSDAPTPHLRAV